ncbi:MULTISPECIES: YoqO family protein [Bacillus]|uniref:YoqO family protein n=1 Tax=Bacillus TaxID=1386 RepID=UPI0015816304|nr:YoqO family protein [Bacillus glycinifermentans]MBU8786932.1 YoqO family protein [Bacillus glycinifermentans]NUJ16009.1 hypothetical protein [Bacillus glycinifermentans]
MKKTGFYGFIASVVFAGYLRWILNDSGMLTDIIAFCGFVFILMYSWDESKKESRKALLLKGTGVVILTPLSVYMIFKGQESINSLAFFSGWETAAKVGCILLVLLVASVLMTFIHNISSKP